MTAGLSEKKSVRFELVLDDLIAFNQYKLAHSPSILRRRRIGLALPPLVWLVAWSLIVSFSEVPEETARKLWWLLLYAPFHFLLHHWRWKRNQGKVLERLLREGGRSPLLGKRRLTLTAKEIREQNPVSEIAAQWPQVLKSERVEAHTFIFLSPVAAIIIPRRAFESEAAYLEFVGAVEEYRNKASKMG